jgi:toxin ParE1/3/4
MDRFKVIFALQAERDLHSITLRIASQIGPESGPEIAERFGHRLIDRALTLQTLPERGRVVPELDDAALREIIFKSYRIVYRIRQSYVEVVRFWHAARGTPEIDSDEFQS